MIQLTPEQINEFMKPVDYSAAAAPYQQLMNQFPELPMEQIEQLARLQQQINNINTSNPYGSVQYKENPDGTYSAVTSFSPEQQKIYNQETQRTLGLGGIAQGKIGEIANAYKRPYQSGAVPLPTDFTAERNRIENELYRRNAYYLDEQKNKESEAYAQRLANRGIGIGSQNYVDQMRDFEKNWGDRYADARTQAIAMGGNEMINSYNTAADAFDRKQRDELMRRNMPLTEYNALIGSISGGGGGSAGANLPVGGGGAPVDVLGGAMDYSKIAADRQNIAASGLSDVMMGGLAANTNKQGLIFSEGNKYEIAREGNEAQKAAAGIAAGASIRGAELNASLARDALEWDKQQYNDSKTENDAKYLQNLLSTGAINQEQYNDLIGLKSYNNMTPLPSPSNSALKYTTQDMKKKSPKDSE